MSLNKIPTEIFMMVLASCNHLEDIASLALVSRRCNAVAGLQLYRLGVEREYVDIAVTAARKGCLGTLQRLAMVCDPDVLKTKLNMYATEVRLHGTRTRRMASFTPSPNIPYTLLRPRCTTPLYEAAERGNIDIVLFLINRGSDVNAHSTAYLPGLDRYFRYLVYSSNPALYLFRTPLLAAVSRQNANMTKVLLEHGASNEISKLQVNNPSYLTAFHVAALIGSVELVNTFLEGGFALVDQPDGVGYPPIYYAAMSPNYYLTIKALKKWGANMNYIVPDGGAAPRVTDRRLAPLLIREQQWRTAARLLELGASIDMQDGQSALLELCREVREAKPLYPHHKERANEWEELVGVVVDRQCETPRRRQSLKTVLAMPAARNLRRSRRKRV